MGIVTLNDSVGSRVQGASGEEPRGPAVFSDVESAPVTDPETSASGCRGPGSPA